MYLNTNTFLGDSNTNTFKYNVFKYKYIGKYVKYFVNTFQILSTFRMYYYTVV